jgi:hypothetical protein
LADCGMELDGLSCAGVRCTDWDCVVCGCGTELAFAFQLLSLG